MKTDAKQLIADIARNFHLPRYHEIPNVGLYLEQTTKYISEYLAPLQEGIITNSMVSNYVKKGLVRSPVKKQYDREQIAQLMFIALAKNVLSLDHLFLFLRLQEQTYTAEKAYNYFCTELENLLQFTFGLKDTIDQVGEDSSDEKVMLRATIITLAHKVYLEKCFEAIAVEEAAGQDEK